MKSYQQLLVLYLKNSSLDSDVIAWSFWDGSGEKKHFQETVMKNLIKPDWMH